MAKKARKTKAKGRTKAKTRSKRKSPARKASGRKTARKSKARKSKARKAPARKSATRRRRKQEGVVDTLVDGVESVQKGFEDSAKMQERVGTRWGTGEG
ncbi:MAG TPA: hypothetical protein VFK79_00505 [Xanthobacteraceae bacterium]|nr:hypothetical protein [Xanthobacteraceae bacterium]